MSREIQLKKTLKTNYSHLPASLVFISLLICAGLMTKFEIPFASVSFTLFTASFLIYLFPVIPLRMIISGKTKKLKLLKPVLFVLSFSLYTAVLFFKQLKVTHEWLEFTGLLAGAGFFMFELTQIIKNFDNWLFKAYFFLGIAYLSMWSWL